MQKANKNSKLDAQLEPNTIDVVLLVERGIQRLLFVIDVKLTTDVSMTSPTSETCFQLGSSTINFDPISLLDQIIEPTDKLDIEIHCEATCRSLRIQKVKVLIMK